MKKILIFAMVIMAAALLAVPVSAEFYEEEITYSFYDVWQDRGFQGAGNSANPYTYIKFWNPDKTVYSGVYYIAGTACPKLTAAQAAAYSDKYGLPLKIYNTSAKVSEIGSGTMDYYVEKYTGSDGDYYYVDFAMFLDEWDADLIVDQGLQSAYWENNLLLYPYDFSCTNSNLIYKVNPDYINSNAIPLGVSGALEHGRYAPGQAQYSVIGVPETRNPLVVTAYRGYWDFEYSTDYTSNSLNTLNLDINIPTYYNLTSGDLFDEYTESGTRSYNYFYPLGLNATNPFTGEIIFRQIGDVDEDRVPVSVYIRSDADYSLIGGATITAENVIPGDYIFKTLDSGFGTISPLKDEIYILEIEAEGYTYTGSGTELMKKWSEPGEVTYYLTPNNTAGNGTGLIDFHVSNTDGHRIAGAIITVLTDGGEKLSYITSAAGYAQHEMTKNASLSYTVVKDGYESFSRTYTPTWTGDTLTEEVILLASGEAPTGGPTSSPTPDIREDYEKVESAFSIIFDNIEAFAILTVLTLFFAYFEWMTPKIGRSGRRGRR